MASRKENVQRALDSADPAAIKESRKTQRQALTRWSNALKKELDHKDVSGQLDLNLISEDLVKEILIKAREAYRDLVDLHEHYLFKKTGIVNTDFVEYITTSIFANWTPSLALAWQFMFVYKPNLFPVSFSQLEVLSFVSIV